MFILNILLDNPPKSHALSVDGSIAVSMLLQELGLDPIRQKYHVFGMKRGSQPPDDSADGIKAFIAKEFDPTQVAATMRPTDRIDAWFKPAPLADEMPVEDDKTLVDENSVQILIMKDTSLGTNPAYL